MDALDIERTIGYVVEGCKLKELRPLFLHTNHSDIHLNASNVLGLFVYKLENEDLYVI